MEEEEEKTGENSGSEGESLDGAPYPAATPHVIPIPSLKETKKKPKTKIKPPKKDKRNKTRRNTPKDPLTPNQEEKEEGKEEEKEGKTLPP